MQKSNVFKQERSFFLSHLNVQADVGVLACQCGRAPNSIYLVASLYDLRWPHFLEEGPLPFKGATRKLPTLIYPSSLI